MTSSLRHYQYYLVMGPDFYGSVHKLDKMYKMFAKKESPTLQDIEMQNKFRLKTK